MYDTFDSLPGDIQGRIKTLIEPPDPETWVKAPIPAFDGRTFLDVINGDDGQEVAARYFDDVEAFERPGHQSSSEDLGRIFHFSEADLDSNRAGLLSPGQRTRLWRQDMLKMLGAAVCLVAGVLFNIALLAGWITAHGRGAGLGVALIVLGLVIAVWSAETWLDLAAGTVLTADGYLRATERIASGRYGPTTTYCFEIAGQTFDVPKEAHDEVHQGKRRLYYLRRTRTVLSVDSLQT